MSHLSKASAWDLHCLDVPRNNTASVSSFFDDVNEVPQWDGNLTQKRAAGRQKSEKEGENGFERGWTRQFNKTKSDKSERNDRVIGTFRHTFATLAACSKQLPDTQYYCLKGIASYNQRFPNWPHIALTLSRVDSSRNSHKISASPRGLATMCELFARHASTTNAD